MWRFLFGRFGLFNLFIGSQVALYVIVGVRELMDGRLKTGMAALAMAALLLAVLLKSEPRQRTPAPLPQESADKQTGREEGQRPSRINPP